MKRLLSFVLVLVTLLTCASQVMAVSNEQFSTDANALTSIHSSGRQVVEIANGQVTEIIGTTLYAEPHDRVMPEEESGQTLLLSQDEIKAMSVDEIVAALRNETPLEYSQVEQLAQQLKSGRQGLRYGIYDHAEWYTKPYNKKTTKMLAWGTKWIGIDAYRSSVGMSKGKSETVEISFSLGFTGSVEIKKFKPSFTATVSHKNTKTVSESQTCPAWTTMNWRPYSTYNKEEWYGRMKITTVIPNPNGSVYKNVWYEDHTGTNYSIINDTTEVWSRVNTAKNVNATTPTPPTTAPNA